MNWEKLGPNLSFTVENKARNLHKMNLLIFQIQWIRYSITSMFSIEKNKILKASWIGKAMNRNVDYLMYYPSRRQMKTLQLQVYIQKNDFMLNFSKC